MKYLMFVYGENNLFDGDQITTKIGEEIQPIVNSDQIKYIYGDGSAVFHFQSDLKFEEMSIYCDILFEELEGFMFILIPFNNKIHSNAGDERIDHLLDINFGKKKPNKNIFNLDEFKYNDEFFDIFINIINAPNPIESFIGQKVEGVCDMTLDELLDKINEKGLKSLTQSELNKLEEYSKTK